MIQPIDAGAAAAEDPLVVVGNGMVSWRLCQRLVELGVNRLRRIVVLGEEPLPAYDRVNLTRLFDLPAPDGLVLADASWYRRHGIELRTGTRVVELDTEGRRLTDAGGGTHPFGTCVLATGSRPFVPPITGADSPGVFVYRTVADLEAIRARAATARRGFVVGGGLLGLEAADVLRRAGLETTVAEASNALMSRQLNEDSSSYVLRAVAALGIAVHLRTALSAITADPTGGGLRVHLPGGEPTGTDLVIIAAGVRPRDELAAGAGLPLAVRGGIRVDDNLETAAPGVYAIGDCASHRGKTYGLVKPGFEMADVLAARLAGGDGSARRFEGSDFSCRLKLLGVEVGTFGDALGDGRHVVHRGEESYRSLVVSGGRVVGATVVGPWEQTAAVERAVREGHTIADRHCRRFERLGTMVGNGNLTSVLDWPDGAVVCHCTNTACGTLRSTVAGGCTSVAELTRATGAGGVCGSCRPQLAELAGERAGAAALAAAGGLPRGLLAAGVAGLLGALVVALTPGVPAPPTVDALAFRLTQLWHDPLLKQVTGFTLLGVSLLSLLLSARKRLGWFRWGNYGFWRQAHSWAGVTTLVGVVAHTGFHLGDNLNRWLLLCFLALNAAGAFTALAVAGERRLPGRWGGRLRKLAARAHILFFIPYPVLVGFHIAKVYLY